MIRSKRVARVVIMMPALVKRPRFLLTLAIGQVLGLLLSGSGVFSQLLKENYFINTPSTQVFFMYFLLAITFTPYLAAFQDNFDKILRDHWWKYGLLAILDVEGNYCFVLAYQYTSLTSIQILGSGGTIVWVMLLSTIFLRAKYRLIHFAGVGICLLGIGVLAYADIHNGKSLEGSNPLLGDALCMFGALCYAITNVSAEFVAKNFSFTHFLGYLGFGSCFISAIQLIVLDTHNLAVQQWNIPVVFFYAGFAISLYFFYILSPITMKFSSAIVVNLSILTGNIYNLFWGLFLFDYKFSVIYFVAFFMILIGVALFTVITPTQASRRESLVTVKYWSDYASSLFCECNGFHCSGAEQEGYSAMNTGDVADSTETTDNDDDDDDDDKRTESTKHIEV